MSSLSAVAASEADAALSLVNVCFTLQARPEPSVMPRVVELFAKRGLVPWQWHSTASDAGLSIEVQMGNLDRDLADYIARCMRQIVGVETVLTSESRAPA